MASASAAPYTRRPARWIRSAPDPAIVLALEREIGIGRLAARVLAHRGFTSSDRASGFLNPSLSSLHDPLLMRGMAVAVERLRQAIERQEPILLYGDYDVDGTTSIVILKKALDLLNARAEFHVPHRLRDGYGMRAEVIEAAAAKGVKLIVSVDTGIRATEVVRQANELGIDVIVTDHHLPEAELPPALAVLNPNRLDCDYPEKNLCGAGVTFKLIQAVLAASDLPPDRQARLLDSFLKMVAIATIADIVPLTGENRVIVRRGLNGLREVKNPGLRALIGVSGLIDGVPPSTHQVGFRIAPRINAAGRMDSAMDVIDLFLTEDAERARQLASQLDTLNRERQNAEAEIVQSIVDRCQESPFDEDCAALVFAEPGWHLGVVGIVASRLVERFCRPVFVLSDAVEDGLLSGSGRSIPGFHLLEALETMPHLFRKFGGHRQAAGLTIARESVDEFRRRLDAHARTCLAADDMRPQYVVDADAAFPDLTERAIDEIFSLAPFGFGNSMPLFYSENVEVAAPPKALGSGKHLNVPLRQQGRLLFFKAWNFGDRIDLFQPGRRLDVLFTLEDDPGAKSRGYAGWSVSLRDARLAG
ncbi:MAG TPA: single-stranded-DNA-specific exonuclease RecJ [Bryobacteraceae bacterium]|nr:single-stranded-DNA-specific exonuclease RecJ [Bryobacteraceae bacterium]